jgi:hypothetical protein
VIIGTFAKKNEGYTGKLVTLTHSQTLTPRRSIGLQKVWQFGLNFATIQNG